MTSPNIEPAVTDPNVEPALSELTRFRFGAAPSNTSFRAASESAPDLGPLTAFVGTFTGNGFNTIFRPFNPETPTPLPNPVNTTDPADNLLELNLTTEKLSFKTPLGSVPNRGSGAQGDIFLNGVPYLQTINDVTVPSQPVGIHFEPGLWMAVPQTDVPKEGATVARMASIPHGTTIDAQGTYSTASGPPTIPAVDITPTIVGGGRFTFQNQDVTNSTTRRIPQDLTPFVTAGTITKEMLADPNTLLRNHIAHQHILSTTTIRISTQPASPLFGGGTDNIAFLLGNTAAAPNVANANANVMSATFWIETVQYELTVPVAPYGAPPRTILAPTGEAGQPVPRFLLSPPHAITKPRKITVTTTQIQYSQQVNLQFAGLNWPHVSVATLVPNYALPIPPSAWQQAGPA
jgi:hypothetical protein